MARSCVINERSVLKVHIVIEQSNKQLASETQGTLTAPTYIILEFLLVYAEKDFPPTKSMLVHIFLSFGHTLTGRQMIATFAVHQCETTTPVSKILIVHYIIRGK